MQFVRRTEWGAANPKRPLTPLTERPEGVKVHYEGTHVPADLVPDDQHHRCAGRVRAIQASHLANLAEGYSDIAYTAMVCPHGWVFEGRGPIYRCAANGKQALNNAHFAVCAMLGDSGLTEPTEAMLWGIRQAIDWLRQDGLAGNDIKGHRDGYATSCPGGPLYAWVQAGAPLPGHNEAPITPAPMPAPQPTKPVAPTWPGIYLKNLTGHAAVRTWQDKMSRRGWNISVDGKYGPKSEGICRQFQTEKGLKADGIVGPATWSATWTAPRT